MATGRAIVQAIATIASLVLVPFGNVSELLKSENPWQGFDAKDANLVVVRAEKVSGASCAAWIRALTEDSPGNPQGNWWNSQTTPKVALRAWEPWTQEELQSIRDCDDQPCKIKLGDAEVAKLRVLPENQRITAYLDLIAARARAYLAKGERKEYEFPGVPVDPWFYLEKQGFRSSLPLPKEARLFVRKLDFGAEEAKPLHQIVDFRAVSSATEAVTWLRDAYDDHYFDSWGEWSQVACEENGVRIVQALFLEFDLLKKTDLFSRMMRGKMRGTIESQGKAYLQRKFEGLKKITSLTTP